MTVDVQITVSLEVAEWIRQAVLAAGVTEDPFNSMLRDVNQLAALRAIDAGVARCTIKPRHCQYCGKSIYTSGQGRPAKFCSDKCRVAAHRARTAKHSLKVANADHAAAFGSFAGDAAK